MHAEGQTAMTKTNDNMSPEEVAADLALAEELASSEAGARNPTGSFPKKVLYFVPLIWTIFQLWYASPLPFIFNFFVINDTEARAIHLAFAIFLAFTAFPTFKRSPKTYIPLQDWVLGLVGAFAARRARAPPPGGRDEQWPPRPLRDRRASS